MRIGAVVALLLCGAALLARCAPDVGQGRTSDGKLSIMVSIAPQKYFVERIGGEYVAVSVMVPPGSSPATYEPKAEQLKALSKAVAYVSIGVPFEVAWMERIASANDRMMMVDTTRAIERRPMGKAGENLDPHIWLSPGLVKIQAQTVCDALVTLDPGHKDAYVANLASFLADIDALDADIRDTLKGLEGGKFMVFHPAWGYFAADYGLEMIPVQVGGQEPSARELASLMTKAKEEGIRFVFAQPEFSPRDAETIAREIGGEVLLISPLAPDWLDNLRKVATTLADVLGR